MKKITHPIYKDYPNQPYISFERDLDLWFKYPEKFPYGIVSKNNMKKLEEDILPGDIIMLWRINFNNFTNETIIPQYFEYKYGINSDESINILLKKGYIVICNVIDSLDLINMVELKRVLKNNNLSLSGKKDDLLKRLINNIDINKLEKSFTLRRYKITSKGQEILKKYNNIIVKHGEKTK